VFTERGIELRKWPARRSDRDQEQANEKMTGDQTPSTDLAMAARKAFMPYLHDHAAAIGYLCILYSALENRVNKILGALSGLEERDIQTFTNQIDLLKKIPILNALAFTKKPSILWYQDIDLMG
jgi:hypothetical protein